MAILTIYIKPSLASSANLFGWPPMFVGVVVSLLDGISVLFLPYKAYGVVVFRSRQNPYKGYPVNSLSTYRITITMKTPAP